MTRDVPDEWVRALQAKPDDDLTRMVFADWLEGEGGNPDWAALIRAHVEVCRDDRPRDTRQRLAGLLYAHRIATAGTWFMPLLPDTPGPAGDLFELPRRGGHWPADVPVRHRRDLAFAGGFVSHVRVGGPLRPGQARLHGPSCHAFDLPAMAREQPLIRAVTALARTAQELEYVLKFAPTVGPQLRCIGFQERRLEGDDQIAEIAVCVLFNRFLTSHPGVTVLEGPRWLTTTMARRQKDWLQPVSLVTRIR